MSAAEGQGAFQKAHLVEYDVPADDDDHDITEILKL